MVWDLDNTSGEGGNSGPGPMDDAEVERIRVALVEHLASANMTVAAAAKQIGVAEGTLSPFKLGQYSGRKDRVAAQVNRWLIFQHDKQLKAREAIPEPAFQRTKSALRLLAMLDYAQMDGDIVVAGWNPGIGKTATARFHKANRPRVTLATMTPSSGSIATAMTEILITMGEKEPRGTPQALARKVSDRFTEAGGMLIIDEAHFLKQPAVDELRTINDRAMANGAPMGLAFIGHVSVFDLFNATRQNAFAQFSSRVGMRDKRAKPHLADIDLVIKSWGITDPDVKEMLTKIAMQPGALRAMTKVMRLATRFARTDSVEPPSIRHIADAAKQLSAEI